MIVSEVKDAENARERMRCLFNLLKLQIVKLMKDMDGKVKQQTIKRLTSRRRCRRRGSRNRRLPSDSRKTRAPGAKTTPAGIEK